MGIKYIRVKRRIAVAATNGGTIESNHNVPNGGITVTLN